MVSKKAITELEKVIEEMTLAELLALRKGMDERISSLKEAERDKFIASIKAQAEQLDLNLNDLAPDLGIIARQERAARRAGNSASGERASPKAKYRDSSTGDSWSGRGRMASWLSKHVEEGLARGVSKEKTLDKYLIKE